jgi:hypothetical protein
MINYRHDEIVMDLVPNRRLTRGPNRGVADMNLIGRFEVQMVLDVHNGGPINGSMWGYKPLYPHGST